MPIKINDIPSGEFTLAIQITSRIKIFIGYRLVAYKPSIRIKVTFGKVGYTLCELFLKKKDFMLNQNVRMEMLSLL